MSYRHVNIPTMLQNVYFKLLKEQNITKNLKKIGFRSTRTQNEVLCAVISYDLIDERIEVNVTLIDGLRATHTQYSGESSRNALKCFVERGLIEMVDYRLKKCVYRLNHQNSLFKVLKLKELREDIWEKNGKA